MRKPWFHRPEQGRLAALLPACTLLACTLAACTVPPDAHVPEFARKQYEPFSRDAVVSIALAEWRAFGARFDDEEEDAPIPSNKPERDPGLWQRVGLYWWLGLNANTPESRWTGKHDSNGAPFPPDRDATYAWSAAFISYVMRMSGAGPVFPYAAAHADYINAAKSGNALLHAERPTTYAPREGDLICAGRASARAITFDALPAPRFPSHCDIVTHATPTLLTVIGGNVADAVTARQIPIDANGLLADPRHAWFVILRLTDRPAS